MAVNVNTVYKTVLYILNKEQRGYITPDEFNNIATQVQLDIFNSYFPDADQANRKNQNNTQNDTEFFNSYINAENKLTPFITDEGTWSKAGITNGYQLWTYIGGRQVIKIGVVARICCFKLSTSDQNSNRYLARQNFNRSRMIIVLLLHNRKKCT